MEADLATLLGQAVAHFEPIFDHYGLLLVFGLILVEGFGVPAPGQTVLIVGGVLAARGQLSLVWLLAVAWSGCVLGNAIGYSIGRSGGTRLLRRLPIDAGRLLRFEQAVSRNSLWLLVSARFVDGFRQAAGIVCGALLVAPWRFATGTVVGATLWTLVYGLGSYYLVLRLAAIHAFFQGLGPWTWGLMALLGGLLLWWLSARASRV